MMALYLIDRQRLLGTGASQGFAGRQFLLEPLLDGHQAVPLLLKAPSTLAFCLQLSRQK